MKKFSVLLAALFLMFEISSTLIAQTTVIVGNNSTSNNARAPQGSRLFSRHKVIVTGTEMTTSGFTGVVASIGWRWNVPFPPAAAAPRSQSLTTTGNIIVYMKDTLGTATTVGGTFIDTNGVGYTKIIDGTLTIPTGTAEINIDIPVGGPGTSSYTPTPGMGVLYIVVYKTTTAVSGLDAGFSPPTVFCTNTGGTCLTYQSTTAPGSIGTSSAFRPETRFSNPILADNVGISAANIGGGSVLSAGKGYNVNATVKNFGTNSQSNIDVYYTVNAGSPVGPVVAAGPLVLNATENVVFSGGNAFTPLTAGVYVLKVYTALVGDGSATNDTLTLNLNILDKISTFPYTETFTTATGWTVFGTGMWSLALCTNPDGVAADRAAKCDFFNVSAGTGTLRSPEMDFTGISNPVLNFYVAYRTFATEADRMQVLVSTDGGLTFSPASTPYNKTHLTSPSLATLIPSTTAYTPSAQIQWRQETVDLSNVGNLTNVVIGFVATSAFGNNAWVDNVIISQPNGLCTDAVVSGPGSYNCNGLVTLDFLTTPVPPPAGNQTEMTGKKENSSIETAGFVSNIPTQETGVIINSGNENDNPNGGTAFVSQYTNNDPGQTIAPNVGFTNATPPVGPPFDPTTVYHDYWFTITYDGNDQTGYATYDIKIDLDGLNFTDPSTLYIVKRTDKTGAWVCQNTTLSGNALMVSGLTDFCDFAIAGTEALPVELSSFVSAINERNVELNWTTTTETNNSGFDIERSSENGTWSKVGSVSGNGTTSTPYSYSFTDRNLASGNYNYRLKQIDFNGNFEYFNLSNEVIVGIPTKFDLSQNYPNPFNPSTKINYDLPSDGKVSLKIFDMSGKEIMTLVNEVKTAGYYTVNFNGSNLSSGIYFYSISAGDFTATKKLTLIK